MLKSEQTAAASRSACCETPAARAASACAARQLVGPQRQLLDEDERRGELGPERRGAPVGDDRLPDLLTERVRRNCAVGTRSERALVEQRREAREELALPRAPLRRPAHDPVELLRERRPKSSGR